MNIARITVTNSGSSPYKLEGRTAKNLYKGPSGELKDKIDKMYAEINRRISLLRIQRTYNEESIFDKTYFSPLSGLDGKYLQTV